MRAPSPLSMARSQPPYITPLNPFSIPHQSGVMRSNAMTMSNTSGCTPLLCAAANPYPHTAVACIASKLSIETSRDLAGRTSVYISCCFCCVRTGEFLAGKMPALAAVRCASGHTPLHVAMVHDCLGLFEVCVRVKDVTCSRVACHTSHVTRHTSHVTRHTSHVTRHTSQDTRHALCTGAAEN